MANLVPELTGVFSLPAVVKTLSETATVEAVTSVVRAGTDRALTLLCVARREEAERDGDTKVETETGTAVAVEASNDTEDAVDDGKVIGE